MSDPVVIVDNSQQIVTTNAAADAVFRSNGQQLLGSSVESAFDMDMSLNISEAFRTTVTDGPREFDLQVSPITDWQSRPLGALLVFREITEQRLREQRLSVLNRVLRHNLRNELTVINNHAAILNEQFETGHGHIEQIHTAAERLTHVGEKAREVERSMDSGTEPVAADVVAIAESVVATHQSTTQQAAIQTDFPEQATVRCRHAGLIELTIDNLVENATEHTDVDEPRIAVSIEQTTASGGQVTVTVTDTSPGIPRHEIEFATSKTRAETPLKHSLSLGLWTINWCVRRLNGTISFETTASAGNRVVVTLPTDAVRKNSFSNDDSFRSY